MSRHIFSIFCANTQTALISSLMRLLLFFNLGYRKWLYQIGLKRLLMISQLMRIRYTELICCTHQTGLNQSIHFSPTLMLQHFIRHSRNFTDNLPSEVTLSMRTYSGNVSSSDILSLLLLHQNNRVLDLMNQLAGNTAHSILFSPPESVSSHTNGRRGLVCGQILLKFIC